MLNQLETEILFWIQNNLRCSFGNAIMIGASRINDAGVLSIITVIVFLLWKKYRWVGVTAAVSLSAEFAIVNLFIKPLMNRTRPYVVDTALKLLGSRPGDASFPSGHTGAAFAVAFVLFLCLPRKAGVTALLIAAMIALSRIYNGAHYPTDILGGIFIALLTSIISWKSIFCKKAS